MKTILRAASALTIIAGLNDGKVATRQTSRREIASVAENVKRKDLVPALEPEIPRLMTESEVPEFQILGWCVVGGSTWSRVWG